MLSNQELNSDAHQGNNFGQRMPGDPEIFLLPNGHQLPTSPVGAALTSSSPFTSEGVREPVSKPFGDLPQGIAIPYGEPVQRAAEEDAPEPEQKKPQTMQYFTPAMSKRNSFALIGFTSAILSILIIIAGTGERLSFIISGFFTVAAIILSHISLPQIKAKQESGKGFAIATMVIGYLLAIGTIAAFLFVLGHLPHTVKAK